jgi:uncharacterized protein YndB with AHSA1/START domain
MDPKEKTIISVQAKINAPIEKVWKNWTNPETIMLWNNASDEWFTPRAENDLRVGGKFLSRMESKDGRSGFDFEGVYDAVIVNEFIEYHTTDGRKVKITFLNKGKETRMFENFEAETTNSLELQRGGWQAILNNFKKYTETS